MVLPSTGSAMSDASTRARAASKDSKPSIGPPTASFTSRSAQAATASGTAATRASAINAFASQSWMM